jgi:uncharacterized membrane protein
MRGHHDLRIVTAAALVCAAAALLLPFEAARLLFAAPLALVLPGYAIAAASFAHHRLEGPRLGLVSLALSLATLVIGALVLNYMPGGIRSVSWALLLAIVIVGCCSAAALRRPEAGPAASWRLPRLKRIDAALLFAGLAAAVAGVVLAQTNLPAKEAIGYTQLWVLPEGGAEATEVQVGVGNQEQHTVPYDLLVRIGDAPLIRRSFVLDPGERRVVRLPAGAQVDGSPVPVVARLLRQNRTDRVYRRVMDWLAAPGSAQ